MSHDDPRRPLTALYRERNTIACALATSVLAAGGRAGVTEDPAGEAGFRLVVVVMLPTGRVGWHMDEADPSRPWANLPRFSDPWELITGFQQIARVREYLAG